MDGETKSPCREASKNKHAVQTKESGYLKSVFVRVTQIWPLKYVFKILKKILSLAGLSPKIENVGTVESKSPYGRRFVSGRKRLGRFARLLLSLAPQKLQCALGYHSAESIGQAGGSDDIRKSPLKPCGKGSKRKQDDLEVEEQQSWVALMNEDLPDEDEEDDPTYEPSNTDTDSEEHHSKNDTESDLEIEEKEGVVMLKESPAKKPEAMVNGDPSNKEEKLTNGNPVDENQKTEDEQQKEITNSSAE
ncbi:hypothetical protein XENTR_v10001364 [Xenopus tropicalis]|uniref:Uncharacterized XB5727280 n=1 Tax=Xenopus tropicalis TaxID=8364 RepID=A0A7D9NLI7_XENTR|nr:uncharacterized protein LOC100495756 [Xenopus tropicalis]KAE8631931.1 hypothetical protein XENTR_v10001364 [Xenopus tropicalis]|eukprot:XP_002937973.1 PREDICTED: uncharacterized protein LOC100495756 [Xenopus tropicalis]